MARVFDPRIFQPTGLLFQGAAQASAGTQTTADTTTYVPYPVNCVMVQTGPLSTIKKRITHLEWASAVKENAKAKKAGSMSIYLLSIPDLWKR